MLLFPTILGAICFWMRTQLSGWYIPVVLIYVATMFSASWAFGVIVAIYLGAPK
jgi:hypothetical protein